MKQTWKNAAVPIAAVTILVFGIGAAGLSQMAVEKAEREEIEALAAERANAQIESELGFSAAGKSADELIAEIDKLDPDNIVGEPLYVPGATTFIRVLEMQRTKDGLVRYMSRQAGGDRRVYYIETLVNCGGQVAATLRSSEGKYSEGRKLLLAEKRVDKPEFYKLQREGLNYAIAQYVCTNVDNPAWDKPG